MHTFRHPNILISRRNALGIRTILSSIEIANLSEKGTGPIIFL